MALPIGNLGSPIAFQGYRFLYYVEYQSFDKIRFYGTINRKITKKINTFVAVFNKSECFIKKSSL